MISADSRPPLRVRDLRKSYGTVRAVNNISLAVESGEIVGLLGPNGAGKTTILSTILGVLQPDGGLVEIAGINVGRERLRALARANFAATYAPLPGNLTVSQNLSFFGHLYSVTGLDERIEELISVLDLDALRDVRFGLLSSGEQARVAIAKALINDPELLLLDEPTASLDPLSARRIREVIQTRVAAGHGAVLWTSHNMYEVELVCHRVILLAHGEIVLTGEPRSLLAAANAATLEDLFVQTFDMTRQTSEPVP